MDEWICRRLRSWHNIILAGNFKVLSPGNCQIGDVVVLLDGAPLWRGDCIELIHGFVFYPLQRQWS